MTKTYTHDNVTYGAAGRRWNFATDGYSYSTPLMPGGRETADKVARIIAGAAKRLGPAIRSGLDGLAKANMHTVFHKAAKAQSRIVHHLDPL
jgi:hypothetical protein